MVVVVGVGTNNPEAGLVKTLPALPEMMMSAVSAEEGAPVPEKLTEVLSSEVMVGVGTSSPLVPLTNTLPTSEPNFTEAVSGEPDVPAPEKSTVLVSEL
jgi:hypothetical protein